MSTLVNVIEDRLALLTIASAYQPMADGSLHRVADIAPWQTADPWFWPTVDSFVMCPPDVTDAPQPPRRPPLTPERTGGVIADTSTWTTIWETLEDGRRMIVGRYPSFVQLWGGVIDEFPDTISVQSFDAFQDALASGASYREAVRRHLLPAEQQHPSGLTTSGPLQPKLGIIGPPAGPEVPTGPGTPGGPTGPPDRRYVDEQGRDPRQPRPHGAPMTCWERISCIGLDIEKKAVTATIEILQTSGYGGPLCDSTGFESVGFWLIEPSHAENDPQEWSQSPNPNRNSGNPFDPCGGAVRFLGSAKVNVADIARAEGMRVECSDPALRYNPVPLHYTVTLALRDENLDLMRFCSDSPRLPALHCVLRWNVNVRNFNYGGAGVLFGDAHTCVVQYPVHQSLPSNRHVLAVGLLPNDCSNVLLSSFIRRGIDTLAVSTPDCLVDEAVKHGALKFALIAAGDYDQLSRNSPLSSLRVGLVSAEYSESIVSGMRSIVPFSSEPLPAGSWLVCVLFGANANDWDPNRDLLLTGHEHVNSVSIVGAYSEFRDAGLEMAGPLELSHTPYAYRERGNLFDFRNFPSCIPDHNNFSYHEGAPSKIAVFFPVRVGAAPLPMNYIKVHSIDAAVFLVPANGTGSTIGDWLDYKTVIEQFVLQGFVVVMQLAKVTSSDYSLADGVTTLLQTVLTSFPQITDPTLLFVGHSQGGSQVATLMSDKSTLMSIPYRVAGAVLLAPTIHSGDIQVMHAPVLTFWGALDTDIPFIRIRCKDKSWADWVLSPLRYYSNVVSSFNAFVFAAGATHFRWIDSMRRGDDLNNVRGIQEGYALERSLILDGPTERNAPFMEHFAVFLSYATYFTRATLLDEVELLEAFTTTYLMPPDVLLLDRSDAVRDAIRVYFSAGLRENINSPGPFDYYHYESIGVHRTVQGLNRRTTTTSALVAYDVKDADHDTHIAVDVNVVTATGRTVSMDYTFSSPLTVSHLEVLAIEYIVLDANGRAFVGKYSIAVTIVLSNGATYDVDLKSVGLQTADLKLTKLSSTELGMSKSEGAILTKAVNDIVLLQNCGVPISWILSNCFSTSAGIDHNHLHSKHDSACRPGPYSVDRIGISCVSDSGGDLLFGLSTLRLVSLPLSERIR